nr:translation initiation factor IF-2-like [Equus asinus]
MQESSSAGQAGPTAAGPRSTPDPDRLPKEAAESRGARRAGAGGAAAATASLSLRVGLPTPGAAAEGDRDGREGGPEPRPPEAARRAFIVPHPRVRESRGRGEPGLGPRRQDDASVFVLPERRADGLPPPGRRHPRPARASPEARGVRGPPLPNPHHSPGGRSAEAGLARTPAR